MKRNKIATILLTAAVLTGCGIQPAPNEQVVNAERNAKALEDTASDVIKSAGDAVSESLEDVEAATGVDVKASVKEVTEEVKNATTEAAEDIKAAKEDIKEAKEELKETAEDLKETKEEVKEEVKEAVEEVSGKKEESGSTLATVDPFAYQSYVEKNISELESVLGTNHTWEVTKGCLTDGGDMGIATWTAADGTTLGAQCEMAAGTSDWIIKFIF